ncbi:hypothetical protein NOVOSPHI9U_10400 [Novosphingobium sp. 9U]|nr:hypothetical protein NOVOSPHI9U_10400 [Novosphingobium sp. 9U]
MVVVCLGRGFVACTAVAEVMPVEDAGLLEQAHGAIDGGDRDARIDLRRTLMQLLDVRMIGALGQHLGDDAALLGDAQATLSAESFDVDGLVHVVFLGVAANALRRRRPI